MSSTAVAIYDDGEDVVESPKANEWGTDVLGRFYYDASGQMIRGSWKNVMDGKIPLEALHVDELRRGQLKNIRGSFGGGPLPTIASAYRRKIDAELIRRAQTRLTDSTGSLVTRLLDIAENSVDEAVAVRAATDLLDRIGLVKQTGKQEVSIEHKFEETLARSVVTMED